MIRCGCLRGLRAGCGRNVHWIRLLRMRRNHTSIVKECEQSGERGGACEKWQPAKKRTRLALGLGGDAAAKARVEIRGWNCFEFRSQLEIESAEKFAPAGVLAAAAFADFEM